MPQCLDLLLHLANDFETALPFFTNVSNVNGREWVIFWISLISFLDLLIGLVEFGFGLKSLLKINKVASSATPDRSNES